jgi:hypothetical protein
MAVGAPAHDREAKAILIDTREEWRAAYEGRETPLSRALRAVTEQAAAEGSADVLEGVLAA